MHYGATYKKTLFDTLTFSKLSNYPGKSFYVFIMTTQWILGCANKDLWALCAPVFTIVVYCKTATIYFFGGRNNWYQSYNSTMIEIGAQKSQSGPIAWPTLHTISDLLRFI